MFESTFSSVLKRMLDAVPNELDKRQGSIIYNALAPAAAEVAQAYIALGIFKTQTHLGTAVGGYLDDRAMDFSIPRMAASPAFRIARTLDTNSKPFDAPAGSRFSVPESSVTYILREHAGAGVCILECEQQGVIGNAYTGLLLPIFPVSNLGRAEITGTHIPGQDAETDEAYRSRVIERLRQKAFGGNVADYKRFVGEIDGVGDLKVFPAWQGGGTVLISVVDAEYNPITPDFARVIKNAVDPEDDTGNGVGIAPIGHRVTVTTPERYPVDIRFAAVLDNVTAGQIQTFAEESIAEYFLGLREGWGDTPSVWIYASRIIEAVLRVPRVVSVSGLTLNGGAGDINLSDTSARQYLPFVGSVTING